MKPLPTSRLLPLLIIVALVTMGVRVGDLWSFASDPTRWQLVQSSEANEPEPKPEAEAEAPKAAPAIKEVEKKPDAAAPVVVDAVKPADAAPAEPIAELGGVPGQYTDAEISVLQSLSQRREELAKRASELDQREALLSAAQQRVGEKVKELQSLRDELKGLLRTIDEQQQARLDSLVKMYETMKPREAAAIIEGLEMNVALDILEQMKESKSAPVLAAMTPQKASEITVQMTERSKLPEIPE